MNDQYKTTEWLNKRKEIIERDNFTCQNQNCKTFDPSKGIVNITNTDTNDSELHHYDSRSSVYNLTSCNKKFTINIIFGRGTWLVLPILQVHHLRYIKGLNVWDYDDKDLITLCRDCHTQIHLDNEIPTFDSDENLIDSKKYEPEDFSSGRIHNFKPWVFVNKIKNEYHVSNIKPRITYIKFGKELSKKVDYEKLANEMTTDFFNRYLPAYSKKLVL